MAPGGVLYNFCFLRFCASVLIPGTKCHFSAKKANIFFGPKMVQKWPKSGQKWPKLPQNRRNKSRGAPRKSQRIPQISELDDSPNARLVGKTCLRAQWCTSHRVTSHCAPFSRMCASTYEIHMPQCPSRGSKGLLKAPQWPYIGSKWDHIASI